MSPPESASADTLFRSPTEVESLQPIAARPTPAMRPRVRLCILFLIRDQKLAEIETNRLRAGGYGVTSWNRPMFWFEKLDTSGS